MGKTAAERISRRAGYPLYKQVQEYLHAKIESEEWAEGSMIPRERDLCRELKVSRITVREAMKLLVQEGKLERYQGRGTFVSSRKLEQRLNKFFSFARWAEQNGIRAESRMLRTERTEANSHIAKHLAVRAGAPVTRIERLRLGDGEPLMVEEIWVAESLCPNLHLKDLANLPLNDIISREYGIPLVRAMETIEPRAPDRYVRKLLSMREDELCLAVEHTAFSRREKIVYFDTSMYRGNRVRFSVELRSS